MIASMKFMGFEGKTIVFTWFLSPSFNHRSASLVATGQAVNEAVKALQWLNQCEMPPCWLLKHHLHAVTESDNKMVIMPRIKGSNSPRLTKDIIRVRLTIYDIIPILLYAVLLSLHCVTFLMTIFFCYQQLHAWAEDCHLAITAAKSLHVFSHRRRTGPADLASAKPMFAVYIVPKKLADAISEVRNFSTLHVDNQLLARQVSLIVGVKQTMKFCVTQTRPLYTMF